MMGWGIAIVLLIERGVPWWAAVGACIAGNFAELVVRVMSDSRARASYADAATKMRPAQQ